jgi:hypothetical protein
MADIEGPLVQVDVIGRELNGRMEVWQIVAKFPDGRTRSVEPPKFYAANDRARRLHMFGKAHNMETGISA